MKRTPYDKQYPARDERTAMLRGWLWWDYQSIESWCRHLPILRPECTAIKISMIA